MTRAPDKPKLLFTPGPINTSARVKQAMLVDLGSRDAEFIALVAEVRGELLRVAGLDEGDWDVVPMQGSGTFGLEAVAASTTPADGAWLVVVNGEYGRRMARIVATLDIPVTEVEFDEAAPADAPRLSQALRDRPDVTHVAVAHCETSSGMVNDLAALGSVVAAEGRVLVVDAMSSFGALSIDFEGAGIDWLVSSPNKCLQGVPGFSLVFARRGRLAEIAGRARSVSLDLHDQWQRLEDDGQFRFTPPTHALLALREALRELDDEGGVAARLARYQENHRALLQGMQRLGFETFLAPEHQSPIITTFLFPRDAAFDLPEMHRRLADAGISIYPGKQTRADTFRIGTIGAITPEDVATLLEAIALLFDRPS